jgi:drug/metabolite transporter (DMT)-like permease
LIAVLGIACTALAHTLFIAGLAVVSAHSASVVAALEPVYAMVFAFALLGETPDARMLVGGALIIAAAIRASGRERHGDAGVVPL